MINCKKSCKRRCDKEYFLFKQFLWEENVVVPTQKLDIEDIVSIIVDPEIISIRVIDTPIGCSAEGQRLTGKKLSIEIKMRQKIVYIAQREVQSVHVVENECYKSVFIVVPRFIFGTEVEKLLNNNLININIEVENAKAIKIDKRNIYKTISLLIKAQLSPCYLMCYTEEHICGSKLFTAFKDGTRKKEIVCFDEGKILMPQWSPSGSKIAYICKAKDCSYISVTDIRVNSTHQVTNTDCFRYINNFSWSADGRFILFTSIVDGSKEIFSVNLNTLEWKQLTYGNLECNSNKPKSSADGEYIAYLRNINSKSNLYIMNGNGLGNRKLTNFGGVKDFCWENANPRIAFVRNVGDDSNSILGSENKGNEIYIIDVRCGDLTCLDISKCKLNIKKIKISLDNRYISFIGERSGIGDIYIFDLLKNVVINLTENDTDMSISDYDWDIDSSIIYYSCKELNYYNIYSICICGGVKNQLSNTDADNIRLSYRPKIL